jgi:acylphosphatase
MKKSIRLNISGSVQSFSFKHFIKEHADKNNVRGYFRNLEDGNVELFLEGDTENVDSMMSIAKRGPKHAIIRDVKEKSESFQDFKNFRILGF